MASVGVEVEARSIKALIFDMDGLLVDSEPASELAFRRFLEGHGHSLRPGTVDGVLGRRLPEAITMVAETYALVGQLDELIAAFDAIRLESLRGGIVAMPGAGELLDWADGRRMPTALATSSSRHQADAALAEANLSGRFSVEATGDEVEQGKPEPDLFLLAARRLGVAPQSCLVFEDAPAGLEAAARAQMARIWVPNLHTRHLPPIVAVDAVLDSLLDAPAWLEARAARHVQASPATGRAGTMADQSTDAGRVTIT